ncbi:MAG: MATE family efflux transporter [Ruminococcaceae bacterium]|nr:MATE family efflux transporter [Oscillospiraceae bacterium]
MASKFELDMTKGSIFKNIVAFAFPLMFSNILQLLYNAADLIVVSNWAGNNAMASVGATGSLYSLLTNLFVGLSIGTAVLVSKKFGAMDHAGVHRAVHTSVLLSVFIGILAMVVGLLFARPLLVLMGTPEGSVLEGASMYMTIIFLGAPATMVYNFGAAILRSVGDTRRPLYILAFTGAVNVVLNLVFVIGFGMGAEGVAIATTVATYMSMAMVIYALMGADGVYKLYIKELRIYKEEFADIMKIGLPAGLQSTVFGLSNTVIQSGINSFGESAIAGCAAAANIEGFVYTAMNSFYQATLTCVGQNYGAKDEKRINKTIRVATVSVAVVGFTLGLLTVVFSGPLLSIYIKNDALAVEFAKSRMLISGLPYFLCGIMEVLTGTLRGLGYSTITAVSSLIGACGFRLLWVATVLPLHRTISTLFLCWPLSWIVVVIMHAVTILAVKKKAMKRMYEA